MAVYDVDKLIAETRRLAADYRRATGKSLAVSSEIARHDACTLLDLDVLSDDANTGFDAIGKKHAWNGKKIQIKGRAIFDEGKSGHRIGQLKLDKEWDAVALVLMDEEFNPMEIYLAQREDIEQEIANDTSSRKNRGAMSVAKFKHLAQLVWNAGEGVVNEEMWDNQTST